MKCLIAIMVFAAWTATAPSLCRAIDPSREEAIRDRGADVMPFDLKATKHLFTKTESGGIQRVIARTTGDTQQVGLIRAHLRNIAEKFSRGDFDEPAHVHGAAMPGLAELRAAPHGALLTRYRDIELGAEIEYSSSSPQIIDAIHRWFDAQLVDHGPDASTGPDHVNHGELQGRH